MSEPNDEDIHGTEGDLYEEDPETGIVYRRPPGVGMDDIPDEEEES